jgi:hypothetical protein
MNYTYWKEYFESNQHHFKNINWDAPDSLTGDEKRIITKSIQQFQEGENSEGKHLFQFAKALNDDEYLSCIRLFIKEEHNHAKVLGRFMEKYKIEKAKGHWVDGVFRWLRKLMGLENSIIVLVTAEIISKIYYDALRNATGSALLQKICSQVLQDEDQHIAFQCHTLSLLHEKKNFLSRFISRSWHLFLMTGTILVVWFYHKKVFRKGGYYFGRFFLQTMLVFLNVDELIKNKYAINRQPLSAAIR